MLLLLTPAFALDLDSYRLAGAPWEAEGSLGVTGAEVGAPGTWSLGLAGIVANEPAPGQVESLDTLRLAFAVVPMKNLRLELEVPAHPGLLGAGGWTSGVGDPELRARVALGAVTVAGREMHVALQPVLALPNGDAELGVGGGGVSGGLTLPVGVRINDKFRVDAQVAVLAAPPGAVGELEMGSWFGYGAGVTWDGPQDLHVSGELTGRVDLEGRVEAEDAPLDLGVGVSWAKESGFGVALGGSVGLLEGPGAPAQRVVLAVGWLQAAPETHGHSVERVAEVCSEPEGEHAERSVEPAGEAAAGSEMSVAEPLEPVETAEIAAGVEPLAAPVHVAEPVAPPETVAVASAAPEPEVRLVIVPRYAPPPPAPPVEVPTPGKRAPRPPPPDLKAMGDALRAHKPDADDDFAFDPDATTGPAAPVDDPDLLATGEP